MALEFIDGMDHYTVPSGSASTKGTKRKWDILSDMGYAGGSATRQHGGTFMTWGLPGSTGIALTGTQLAPKKTRCFGFYTTYQPAGYLYEWRIMNAGGRQCTFVVRQYSDETVTPALPQGTLEFRLGDSNGFRHAYSSQIFSSLPRWIQVEIKLTIGSADGACLVKVNGEEWINVSNVNTQATGGATQDGIRFWGTNGSVHGLDDLYILNTDGPKPWNDLLGGNWQVMTLFPDADSAVNKSWTPNSGSTNYTQVDDTQSSSSDMDDDTTYITGGGIDTYKFNRPFGTNNVTGGASPAHAYPPLKTWGGDILGVQNCMSVKTDSDGVGGVYLARTGEQINSPLLPVNIEDTGRYRTYRQLYEVNPVTGRKWKHEDISEGEFGIRG